MSSGFKGPHCTVQYVLRRGRGREPGAVALGDEAQSHGGLGPVGCDEEGKVRFWGK